MKARFTRAPGGSPTRRRTLVLLFAAALGGLLSACGDGNDNDDGAVLRAPVSAASGGAFETADKAFRITIPAGALDADGVLRVERVDDPPSAGQGQFAASDAFAVSLGNARLTAPATLELQAIRAPLHPELGEIARLGNSWDRLDANFYRAADRTVVALTAELPATVRVVFRRLQTTSGTGVPEGLAVLLDATYGNEEFFGGLGLHQVLNNVAPTDAVALGAQVDLTKVPQGIVDVMGGDDLAAKDAALADPATTRALIKAGAVVGVVGVYDDPASDTMSGAGITCALCHVTVTPTEFQLTAGPTLLPIGAPLYDGVPNSAMDAGRILSFTQGAVDLGLVDVLQTWGPGRFDIRALNVLEDGVNNPTEFPPIWNFVDLEEQGYSFGWDGLFVGENALASQAEAVFDLVMAGNGAFGTASGSLPPALAVIPPQDLLDALAAEEAGAPGNLIPTQDLLDLQTWMRSVPSPAPGAFDEAKAEQGFFLFNGKGLCSSCHTTADLTGPGLFDFTLPPEAGGLAGGIRVPPLRGVSWTAPYLHDGSVATLPELVGILNQILGAELTDLEQEALVEYLKSL